MTVHLCSNMLVYSVVFLMFVLRYGSAIDQLPCTENVDAAGMTRARAVLENHVPENFQLYRISPVYVQGVNPHRWRAYYHNTNNIYTTTCGTILRARHAFQDFCPPGCTIGSVEIRPVPGNPHYCVEFIRRCRCHRPHERKRRSGSEECTVCKGWIIHPNKVTVDSDFLPCPDFVNETVISQTQRIIQNHTPPGYNLDTITPIYTQGHNNFWRWECTFSPYGNGTECAVLRDVYTLLRNYCPEDSDVHKRISVQLTPNKERLV